MTPVGIPPPKITPVLQVGITGHRNLTGADPVVLQAALHDVFTRLEAGAGRVTAKWPGLGNTAVEFRCVSALAAGTDQLAAGVAVGKGWALAAPLPFLREIYRNDFPTDADKALFDAMLAKAAIIYEMDGVAGQPEAYSAVGALVLEQSDVLVAVWDGQLERGMGGTAEVVREARAADIPVLVIDAAPPHAIRIFAADGIKTSEDMAEAALTPHPPDKVDALAVYYREHRYTVPTIARKLANIERVALFHPPRKQRPEAAAPPQAGPLDANIEQARAAIEPYLTAADTLAVKYATLYRASVALKYLAVLPVVAAALLTLTVPQPYGVWLGFAAQLVAIITFLIGYNDRHAGWHRRFIDYRYMAERLRYAPLLAMFGSTATLPRLPPYQMAANSDWVNWYLHGAVRKIGLVSARRDLEFMDGLRRLLLTQLEEQIDFYAARSADANLLASRLQTLGVALFVAGLGFAVIGGGLKLAGAQSGQAYPVIAAVAAALGGLWPAIFGLRSQREYSRLAERYDAMVRQLRQTETRLARDGAIRGQVERITREAVDAMLAEVSDWRILIKARDFSPY